MAAVGCDEQPPVTDLTTEFPRLSDRHERISVADGDEGILIIGTSLPA